MSWDKLLNSDIQKFILEHENDDVSALALSASMPTEWPSSLILGQIKSRQKALKKFPQWVTSKHAIVFPDTSTIEQASSSATAQYKASLFKGERFVDLTAGAGIDTLALAKNFKYGAAIDADPDNAALLAHNTKEFELKHLSIQHARAEDFIKTMPAVDLVMIDPQRRTTNKRGLYKLSDCQPNLLDILPTLKEKTKTILLKASPMADITQTCALLEQKVSNIYVVEYQGECKELLFIIRPDKQTPIEHIQITALQINDEGRPIQELSFSISEEQSAKTEISSPMDYIYEPAPCITKAGAFKTLASRFHLKKLHPHTHLYTSDNYISAFIGRVFTLENILPVNRKTITLNQANISVRNFPASPEELRKKLKIKDGGEKTLMACTYIDKNQKEHKALLQLKKTQ